MHVQRKLTIIIVCELIKEYVCSTLIQYQHILTAFDTLSLLIQSFLSVNLSTEVSNKLRIYQEHFERQYIDSTREFYKLHGSDYMTENGVQNYMRYVSHH